MNTHLDNNDDHVDTKPESFELLNKTSENSEGD